MRYDEVLTVLGDFGRYQRVVFFLLCLPIMFVGIQIMSPVFTLATPKHRCAIPGLSSDTYAIQNSQHQALVDLYIPPGDVDEEYAKCQIYKRNNLGIGVHDDNITEYRLLHGENNNTETDECDDWVFDKSVFENTAITDTKLVCSSTIYRAHATTAFNVGALFSLLLGGTLSDRFGRKLVSMVDLVTMVISSTVLIWLPNIYVFIAIRLLIGIGFGVFFNVIFVYAMEFIGPSARTVCGVLGDHVWAVGILFQSVAAYYVRSWRTLQLIFSLPIALFLLYWWKLPNSGRWLFAKGYVKEGKTVLAHMASVNKVDIDINYLSVDVEDKKSSTKGWVILELLRHRKLAIQSVIVWLNWFVVSLLYVGLSLNVGNLHGDIFLNFALSAIMEFVAYTICIPGMIKIGRKRFYCACMIIGGAVLLLVIFPDVFGNKSSQWVIITLVMIGKLAASAAYAVVYLMSAEIFPTVIRATTMSICSASAAIGGMVAPYIVELANLLPGQFARITPLIIFGASSLAAGLLSLTLPETSKRQMPDTIADMKSQTSSRVKETTIKNGVVV